MIKQKEESLDVDEEQEVVEDNVEDVTAYTDISKLQVFIFFSYIAVMKRSYLFVYLF